MIFTFFIFKITITDCYDFMFFLQDFIEMVRNTPYLIFIFPLVINST